MAPFQPSHATTIHLTSSFFQLFPQEDTQKRYSEVGKTYIYDRYILLDTNGVLPPFPLRLYAGATHMTASAALSPYTNVEEERDIDYTATPLCFDVSIHAAPLKERGLTTKTKTPPSPFLPEVKEILSRLRFFLKLPTRETLQQTHPVYEVFVSQPDEGALNLGELSFRHFTPEQPSTKENGKYYLMFPSDDAIMQSLQGCFVLLPEK